VIARGISSSPGAFLRTVALRQEHAVQSDFFPISTDFLSSQESSKIPRWRSRLHHAFTVNESSPEVR
jgi:hypothetical protein